MKTLMHKGYIGSIEASLEDDCLYGKLLFIKPLVSYEGDTVAQLEENFREAVDDYLEACEEQHAEAEKPCKGSLNVRLGPDLHMKIALAAREKSVSLNEWIKTGLETIVS